MSHAGTDDHLHGGKCSPKLSSRKVTSNFSTMVRWTTHTRDGIDTSVLSPSPPLFCLVWVPPPGMCVVVTVTPYPGELYILNKLLDAIIDVNGERSVGEQQKLFLVRETIEYLTLFAVLFWY